MSQRINTCLPVERNRPTRWGTRRRPPSREVEQRRPSPIYRAALEISLAKMVVIDRLRDEGFCRS